MIVLRKKPQMVKSKLSERWPGHTDAIRKRLNLHSPGIKHFHFCPQDLYLMFQLTSFELHVDFLPWPWACSWWPTALTSRSHRSPLLLSVILYRKENWRLTCWLGVCMLLLLLLLLSRWWWFAEAWPPKMGQLCSCVVTHSCFCVKCTLPCDPKCYCDFNNCVRLSNPLMFKLLSLEVKVWIKLITLVLGKLF